MARVCMARGRYRVSTIPRCASICAHQVQCVHSLETKGRAAGEGTSGQRAAIVGSQAHSGARRAIEHSMAENADAEAQRPAAGLATSPADERAWRGEQSRRAEAERAEAESAGGSSTWLKLVSPRRSPSTPISGRQAQLENMARLRAQLEADAESKRRREAALEAAKRRQEAEGSVWSSDDVCLDATPWRDTDTGDWLSFSI